MALETVGDGNKVDSRRMLNIPINTVQYRAIEGPTNGGGSAQEQVPNLIGECVRIRGRCGRSPSTFLNTAMPIEISGQI